MQPIIFIAHSRNKHGFTAYSHEYWGKDERFGRPMRSGWHTASADTLEEALAAIERHIRQDWAFDLSKRPQVVDCGKVSVAIGKAHLYQPKVAKP